MGSAIGITSLISTSPAQSKDSTLTSMVLTVLTVLTFSEGETLPAMSEALFHRLYSTVSGSNSFQLGSYGLTALQDKDDNEASRRSKSPPRRRVCIVCNRCTSTPPSYAW